MDTLKAVCIITSCYNLRSYLHVSINCMRAYAMFSAHFAMLSSIPFSWCFMVRRRDNRLYWIQAWQM